VITGRLTGPILLGATALALTLFTLARFVWRTGLRYYSGASA
jgi:ABC-2 type transport system permease protein